jgi:hypothetical protein
MDVGSLSLALNAILACAAIFLIVRLTRQNGQVASLSRGAAYSEGYQAGRKELLDSIRYEREVFECRRAGIVKKETTVKIREAVFLANLRIAQSEHEVVLASEVNEENLWSLVDRVTQAAVGPAITNVIRRIAPGVQHVLKARAH